jgi:hypothetical protein
MVVDGMQFALELINFCKRPINSAARFMMKTLWHKYKVWLLIGGLYSVFCMIRIFRALKSFGRSKLITMGRA